MVRILSILLLVVVWGSIARGEPTWRGQVSAVVDGDTLTVSRGKKPITIRLFGIDAPELDQARGEQARQLLLDLVSGKPVTVTPRGSEGSGRVLAQVSLVKINVIEVRKGVRTAERRVKVSVDLSEALLKAGLAWWYREHAAKDRKLAALEDEARQAKRGLWAEAHPAPPWEWRQSKHKAAPVARARGPYHGDVRAKVLHAPGCRDYHCKHCTAVFQRLEAGIRQGYRLHRACTK